MVKRKIKKVENSENCCISNNGCCGCGGVAYILGMIGAAIYYISNATGFWNGVVGLLKALVWPAILVLEVLKYMAV